MTVGRVGEQRHAPASVIELISPADVLVSDRQTALLRCQHIGHSNLIDNFRHANGMLRAGATDEGRPRRHCCPVVRAADTPSTVAAASCNRTWAGTASFGGKRG